MGRQPPRKPGECRPAHLDDLGIELVGAATPLLILLTTTPHALSLAIWDVRMDSVVRVITGRKRRQHWSAKGKLRMVAEMEEQGVRVRAVAARHGVCEGPTGF